MPKRTHSRGRAGRGAWGGVSAGWWKKRSPPGRMAPDLSNFTAWTKWGGRGTVGTIDIFTLIYLLQLLQPIFGGIGTGVGVVLQLVFLLLDLGTFFLGFV